MTTPDPEQIAAGLHPDVVAALIGAAYADMLASVGMKLSLELRLLADNPQLLPKPEPDRLTVAARECWAEAGYYRQSEAIPIIRAIIAREVAAAEPSDEAIGRVIDDLLASNAWTFTSIRAALKGEGA